MKSFTSTYLAILAAVLTVALVIGVYQHQQKKAREAVELEEAEAQSVASQWRLDQARKKAEKRNREMGIP